MSDREELLRRIEREFGEIRASIAGHPVEFAAVRATLGKSAALIEKGDAKKALNVLLDAKRQIEKEKTIITEMRGLEDKRSKSSNYQSTEREHKLEEFVRDSVRQGRYDEATKSLSLLAREIRKNISGNIENCFEIFPPEDTTLELGKGNTLKLAIANNGPVPINIVALSGKCDHGKVTVFRKFRGFMKPETREEVSVNIIPEIAGDMIVEISAEIQSGSKTLTLTKQTSLRVESPVVYAPETHPGRTGFAEAPAADARMRGIPAVSAPLVYSSGQTATRPSPLAEQVARDPLELVERGGQVEWAGILDQAYRSKSNVDLTGIQEVFPNYQTLEGYRNLYLSLFRLNLDQPHLWEAWLNNRGIVADEFTNRCFGLMFRFAAGGMRIEFEHDNSTGTTNKDYFTTALHIASGYLALDKERRREMKTWKLRTANPDGSESEFTVDRSIRRDDTGGIVVSVFAVRSQNNSGKGSTVRRTRVARSQ